MQDALYFAFIDSDIPWMVGVYWILGYLIVRPKGSLSTRLMSALGWPLEVAQRLSGQLGLPYLFVLPNLLIFGLYTFSPMFINVGFSVTDGQSIQFDQRPFAGDDNLQRLLAEVQIDTGGENREDDKFLKSAYDTLIFVICQVPIMIALALATALVLNRDIIARGFWRSVFFYPVMLSPVVV